jgi:hypothetical protein
MVFTLTFRETSSEFTRPLNAVPGLYGKAHIRLTGLFIQGPSDGPVEVRLRWGSASKATDMGTGNPTDTIAIVQSVLATSIPAGDVFRHLPQGPTNVSVSLRNPATGELLAGVTACTVMLEVRVHW